MDFEYDNFEIPNARFKISPSSIGKFFDYPSVWFKEFLLGEREFIASTSTVLGTVIHALAECYATGQPHSKEECDAYIDKMANEVPEVDADQIKALYPGMASILINGYVSQNKPTIVEEKVYTEVKKGIFVGGKCDNLTNDTIVDYKTASSKPNTDTIPFGYLIQLLAYVYCYRALGRNIRRVRIVYVVRPTKTLPERIFVVSHEITDEDWKLIENTLELIADSILFAEKHPEAIPLIFKSQLLKDIKFKLKDNNGKRN